MSSIDLLLATANPAFKIITVKYAGSPKSYVFKTMLPLEVGDNCVVDTAGSLAIVEVVEVVPGTEHSLNFGFSIKWVVSKVCLERYQACVDMERKANVELNKVKFAKQQKELLDNLKDTIGVAELDTIKSIVKL